MKKNQKSLPAAVESTPSVAAPAAKVAAPAPKPKPVFRVVKADFTPPKGFATVLFSEVAKQPGTADDILARLLASGEYQKVAPKAAELRPMKPVAFLLKTWAASGKLAAA